MSSPAKLTDTQRAILFEASKRKDRCLIAPKTLKGAATQKVAAKLLKAGLVSEIKAKSGMEIWRRDEETGQAYSLKLTVAGLKAIPADERGSQSIPSTAVSPNTNEDSSKAKTAANMAAARSATAAPTATAPRQGTKIARVIELLQRDQGARLEELIAATGWLPAYRASRADRPSPSRLRRPPGAWRNRPRLGLPRRRNSRGQRVIQMRPSPKSLTRRPINSAAEPHGRTAAGSLDQNNSVATRRVVDEGVRSCPRAGCGRSARPVVCPAKAGMFSRRKAAGARVRSPVVWIAGWRETRNSEAYRQRLPSGRRRVTGP